MMGTYGGSRVHTVSFARSKKLICAVIPFPEIGPKAFSGLLGERELYT
jgi:hypothetical protein